MLLEPALALRHQRSIELNNRIGETLFGLKHEHQRADLAMRAASLAHEHHSAFLRLMDSEHFASAAALLRPIAEASMISYWVSYSARKDWIDAASTTGGPEPPTLDKMIRALAKRRADLPGIAALSTILNTPAWKRYHAFTHGGIDQLSRRSASATFAPAECLANFHMADNFVLAGTAIHTAWFDLSSISALIKNELIELGRELRDRDGGPPVMPWQGLPRPILD